MAKITAIPTECPDCGGPVWDNTKRPKKNPKAPDAACKDKEQCKWAGWLDTPKSSGGGRVAYSWDELGRTYQRCRMTAERVWKGSIVDKDASALVAATAALFIAAKDCGLKVEKVEPPKPKPEPEPPPFDDEEMPF